MHPGEQRCGLAPLFVQCLQDADAERSRAGAAAREREPQRLLRGVGGVPPVADAEEGELAAELAGEFARSRRLEDAADRAAGQDALCRRVLPGVLIACIGLRMDILSPLFDGLRCLRGLADELIGRTDAGTSRHQQGQADEGKGVGFHEFLPHGR